MKSCAWSTVTLPGGAATKARVLGYRVGGKTGASRKASGGGYSRRYIALFAGLVPASHPRFSMVVMVNDPAPEHRLLRRPGVARRCSITSWTARCA